MMLCALVCVAGSCKVGLGDSVDTEAPSVKIVYPDRNTNAIIRDTFILYGDCDDDKQITAVKVTLVKTDDTGGETVLKDAPATVDSTSKHWRISLNEYSSENKYAGWQFADGKYSVIVRAYDGSHDSSSDEKSSDSSSFEIDNTPPVFVIKNPGVVKSGSSSPSAYGSIFTIEGTVAELHSVSSMDVTIYDESGNIVSKENYNGEEISSFREENIETAGGISVIIAQAGSQRYDGIYGNSSGTQKYTCSIRLTDNSKKYVAPPADTDSRTAEEAAADEKGNSTSSLYLYDDVYDSLLSQKKETSKKLQPTDLRNILNGTKSDDEAKKILAGAEKDTSSAEESGRLYFSLNPNANPTYQVNGFEYKFGANATNQQASSGNAVSVTVTQGLDQTQIDLDGNEKSNATVKVWMKEYTAGPESKEELAAELAETLAKKVRDLEDDRDGYSDSTFTEYSKATDNLPATEIGGWKLIYDYGKNNSGGASVSTKTFSVTLPEGSIVLNKYYMLAVTGRDIDGVEFAQNTIYGFLGNEAGVPPTLKILSPGSSSLQAATGFSFSGSAVLTGGSLYTSYLRATLSVTDQDTNADLGTYTEEISRAGADKGWTSTAAFTCGEDGSWTFSPSGLKDYEKIKAEKYSGKSYLYTLELYGKSSSGHDSTVSSNVQIDTVLPVVSISSITPTVDGSEYDSSSNTYVNGTITVKGAVEETNLESVVMEVYAGDGLKETRDLGKVYSFSQTIDTTALLDEVLLDVRVTATDKVGNTATYSSRSVADSEYKSLKISQKTDNPVITLNNASIEGFTENAGSIGTEKGNLFGVISNNKISVSVSDDDLIKSVTMKVYNENGEEIAPTTTTGEIGKSTYSASFALPSAEGVYKVEVIATDDILSTELSGEREPKTTSTGKFYVAVSAGAPAITLDSVKTYLTATPSFTGTVSSTKSKVEAKFTKANIDGKDADETELSKYNNMLSQPEKGTANWTVSFIDGNSLDNGKYTVRFTASNDYGESNSSEAEFTVDNEKPAVKITEYNSVKNENGFTEAQKFYLNPTNIKTIKGTCADNESGSGIDSVYYHIGAIETGKETPSTENGWILANLTKTESETGWTISLTDLGNLTEGETYKVHIKAKDNAGNISEDYNYISLYIDKTGPELTASVPDSGLTYTKNEKVYRVFGSNSFKVSVTATDVAGVASVSANSTSLVKDENGSYTGTVSVTPDSNGFASISVVAMDSVGNSSKTTIDDIMIDSTAPIVAISSYPENATKDEFVLSGTVSDNLGVESVVVTDSLGPSKSYAAEVSSDGKWSVTLKPSSSAAGADETKDGSHTYTVTAKDKVGNTSTATCRVTTDTTAPYWYTGNTEAKEPYISTKASSEKITVSGVEHSLYNSTSVTVAAKAKDATTNVGHLLYNLNDEKDSSSAVVWKSVDNGNITVENLAQGLNTLKIKAADEAGNETSEAVISFFVDSLAPAEPVLRSVDSDSDTNSMADFAAQNKQKLVNGKEVVTFTLEAADDTSGGKDSYSGIASVELTKIGNKTLAKAISGTFVSEENGKKVYSITVPAGELASGSANVTVKDRAGNAATLGMFNFLLDNKAPAVSMSSPAGDVNKTISLSANATDNQEIDGTTLKLEYSLDKTAWTELSSVNAGPEYKAVISDSVISVTGFDTTKFADKSTVYVRAVISDKAKNEGKSEEVALRINQDSDRPVVKIDNLSRLGDGTFILKYGTNAQITGTLSDDDSTSGAVVEEFVISESPYNGSGSVENLAKKFDPTTGDFTFEPENTEDGAKTLYFYIKDNGGNEFYTTASTGADSSGNTTYLKNPKLYLKTEQLDDSLAAKVFAYNSDSNSPTVTAGKGVLYSDNAGENASKDANGETFDFASSNSTLNTSFVAGGSERRFVKFQFEANDASGIEGMTLELFDEANNSVLKLKTPEISASGFTTSGTIEQKQNDKTNETDPTTSIWTTEIIDLEGKTTAQYTAKIVPYDKAGLAGNGSYSFFIDNSAPEIVIRSPISGTEVTGTVSIAGTATDTGSAGTANIQWLIPKKENVTVANTKTGTEKLEYLKSLNWNGGEDALAATATLTSWQFDFDGKNDDAASDPKNFIFKGGNPALDVYDSDVFATNITDGIYALPVYFMATDAIGNYSIYTEYALRHNPDGDKPKLDFLYPTASDYGKGQDYVVLGGTIRATGSAVIPSGTTTVRSVYYQIAGENGSFLDSDKTAASTNYGYAVLTAYDVVKEITGTDYSPTSRTIDDSMLKKFGFSTKTEMDAWWGIKANGTAAWNIILNERGELNPKTNGSTTNIKLRTCGINAEGKFGAWTSGDNVISIHIDDKAPVINSIVKQYKDEITSNPTELPAYTASQNYVSDMFLRGQWYLEVTLLDETAVTSYSVQKDTTSLTEGSGYYVQSNVEDKSINKNGYRLYIPIDKDSDSVSYTITANDAEHTATQTFSFRLDNKAPTLESLTGNGQKLAKNGIIEDSNYVYTVGGKSEDSGSGVERVLFYFMRKSGTTILDPMITTGTDKSKIELSTLTELPVKQGEHTFYLYAKKEQTSSATKDTFTLESADSHIRTGGLIYIDGLYRKITKLEGTTVTFEPAMSEAKASVTAYFPIAQVIDNTATEKVKSNSANPFTFESGDDGDGMPETFSKTGTTWTWDATIHSYNMPDGPVTLVMLAFDAAGNVNGTRFNLMIANNAPRLAKVWLGTDLNGDGNYTSDSTLEEIVEYNILNAEGIEQKTYTLDFTETVSDKDSTLKYPAGKFTIKNGLAVIPEFTGGNKTIGMIPNLNATDTTATTPTTGTVREASASDTKSTTKEKTLGDSAGKFSAQKLNANSENNSVYGFVMDKDELGNDTDDTKEKGISFTFWDKTEETTQGTDSQYSVLFVKNFVLEQSDSKSPVVRVNPFYWNSVSSNSLYENSLKNGHIELEADLPKDTFTDSGSASKDRDPKVSGKIVFTGTAYDNHGLSSISFSYGSLGSLKKVVGATYDATNKKWSEKGTLSTDGYEFKVYDAIPEDANFKTDTAYFNQSGHKIYWTLAVDTENTNVISTTAETDISLTVLAKDSNSNTTNATVATTVDDDASYNKPVYKTDVVPYIAGIKTNLSSLKKNNSSVYDRTALGHYPVSSSETIYVYGFNINGGSLQDSSSNTTSLKKIDDATAQKWYSSASAPSGSVYETESIKEFKSGKISVIVKDISSLNNENADNARGNYEKENSTITGDYSIYQNYYNRQPNNDSNNRLTDDVILDVWEFNSTAARPISGMIEQPVMKINPDSGMVGFAFVNGPLYFSMGGKIDNTEYSAQYWMGSYDFFTSVGFAYDKLGYSYGCAAGGDINSTSADKFQLMTSRWGRAGIKQNGSYQGTKDVNQFGWNIGTNSLRMESIGQKDSSGVRIFDKQRIKSPSFATAVHGSSTNLYLAYYDNINDEIRFKYGSTTSTNRGDFGSFTDYDTQGDAYQYRNAYVSMIAGSNTGRNAGEYVSIAVVSKEETAIDDVVVAVWYDATDRCLRYSYNTTPTVARNANTDAAGWSTPETVFTGDMENAGEWCQIMTDKSGGIHIAAYDPISLDLVYAYKSSYQASGFETCIVDGYGVVGSNLTLDVAKNADGKWIPYIGYYATSCVKPKVAYLSDTSANAPAGTIEDVITRAWEISIIPTTNTIPLGSQGNNKMNVGVWKDKDSWQIKNSVTGDNTGSHSGSSYGATCWDKVYGNGTANPIVGYAIKSASNGYIETAQMR